MSDQPEGRVPSVEGECRDEEGTEDRELAVARLLWTPTEGQDVTKSYFPLSESSDNSPD